MSFERPAAPARKRRRVKKAPTAGSGLFDALLIILLVVASLGPAVLFGGTLFWTSSPFILCTVVAMVAVGLRHFLRGADYGVKLPPGTTYVALLALYVLIRAIVQPGVPYQIWTELYQILAFLILYLCCVELFDRRGVWQWLLWAFFLYASIQALYAIGLHSKESNAVLWLVRPDQYGMRASGTFICPNHFGQLLQMGMIVSVGTFVIGGCSAVTRVIASYCFVVSAPALILSGSRASWVGTFAGIGCLLIVNAARRSWKRVVVTTCLFAVSVTAISIVAYTQIDSVTKRVDHAMKGSVAKADIRTRELWPDTLRLIDSAPVHGTGPGTFRHVFARYRDKFQNANLYLRYAHNEYLHTAAEYGVPMTIALTLGLIGLMIRMLYRGVKTRSDSSAGTWITWLSVLFAAAIHAIFDFNAHLPGNMFPLAFLSGIFAARLYHQQELTPVLVGRTGLVRSGLVCGLVLSVVLAIASVSLYRTSRVLYDIKNARKSGDEAGALQLGDQLRRVAPWHWMGHRLHARDLKASAMWCRDVELRGKLVAESRESYQTALKWNPYDIPSRTGLAGLLLQEGELESALEEFEVLRELDAFNQNILIQQGLVLKRMGRLNEAMVVFQDSNRMKKGNRQVELNIKELKRLLREEQKNSQKDSS